jgi:Tol biopolymer transport system component
MDADGSNVRRIAESPVVFAQGSFGPLPSWSPDGSRLALAAHHRLVMTDGNGALIRTLGFPGTPSTASWSADGTRFAFSVARTDGQPYERDAWIMKSDFSDLKMLKANARDPILSPDGRLLAFHRDIRPTTTSQLELLFVSGIDGFEERQIANSLIHVGAAQWSSDGKNLVFEAFVSAGSDIFVASADGSTLTNITREGGLSGVSARSPAWIPTREP